MSLNDSPEQGSPEGCARPPLADPREGLIHYPFQVRPGLMVFLYLPPDLTRRDVTRISAMLTTLVVDEDRSGDPHD